MSIELHNLKPAHGSRVKKFRIGRGLGSGRGKTSGKGTKGQRSRTGGKKGLKLKGLKKMLLRFPKSRGFKSLKDKVVSLPLSRFEHLADGTNVTMAWLKEQGMVRRIDVSAKIIGTGPLTKKLNFSGLKMTAGAKTAIEKAGGKVA